MAVIGSEVSVLVAGSGVMGRGIAASFARAGVPTAILSRDPGSVAGAHKDVQLLGELPLQPPQLIIETIPELIDLKFEFNARIEEAYGDACVLGSNTSSLPLQKLADKLRFPEKYCGIHYFQPADIAPVVELARVAQSADDTIAVSQALLEKSGKYVVNLAQPIGGLLVNRLQQAILREGYYLIEQGICTARDIDEVAKRMLGPRMSVTGLIEQKDISGLDTHALAQAELVPQLYSGDEPSGIVQGLYKAGKLGVKSGTGFYDWRDWNIAGHREKSASLLTDILALLDDRRTPPPPLAPED
jgi:3-hydroxybutyryl-CoA dehydrogenase